MAWTTHLPPGYLDDLRRVFADSPKVLEALDADDGYKHLTKAFAASLPELPFLKSATDFVSAADSSEGGVIALLKRARAVAAKEELWNKWWLGIGIDLIGKFEEPA